MMRAAATFRPSSNRCAITSSADGVGDGAVRPSSLARASAAAGDLGPSACGPMLESVRTTHSPGSFATTAVSLIAWYCAGRCSAGIAAAASAGHDHWRQVSK